MTKALAIEEEGVGLVRWHEDGTKTSCEEHEIEDVEGLSKSQAGCEVQDIGLGPLVGSEEGTEGYSRCEPAESMRCGHSTADAHPSMLGIQ